MEIVLIAVGRTKIPFVVEGIKEYMNRLKHYISVSIVEIPDVKSVKSFSQKQQKDREGEALLQNVTPADYMILLDEKGKEYSSIEFASYIEKILSTGRKRIIFVVGGPYGFSKSVYERADSKLSLSKMTFNHEMVRLFFVEQVYRAMTILRGEPYHHE